MVTLVVFLLVLLGGLISLASLPLVVSLPLMVVIGAFAILVIAEIWRSYQELDSARTLENVGVSSVVRHAAAPAAGRELIGE
ncbi:MAG: hypothetical protein AB7I36_10895 [Rhodospirillaceae bacterium]